MSESKFSVFQLIKSGFFLAIGFFICAFTVELLTTIILGILGAGGLSALP